MEMLEKVEKLRKKANVSYEDAKKALEDANGDILDAMILLEKEGKISGPEKESYSTRYEDSDKYVAVVENADNEKSDRSEKSKRIRENVKTFAKKLFDNNFVLERNGNIIIDIPIWVFILIVLITWEIIWLVIIVSLFFGCHYSFQGPNDLSVLNEATAKASEAAECIKSEFTDKQ